MSTLPVQGMTHFVAGPVLLPQGSSAASLGAQPASAYMTWEQERKAEQCLSSHAHAGLGQAAGVALLPVPTLCLAELYSCSRLCLSGLPATPPPTVVFSQGMRGSWLKLASLLVWPCQGR